MPAWLGEGSPPGHKLLLIFSVDALWDLFYKTHNPIRGDPPSQPNHLPRAPHPHTITLDVRIPNREFWVNTSIKTIAQIHTKIS